MVEEHTAKAISKELQISTKKTIEVANFIKNKKVATAKKLLEQALNKKIAIPFKRFNRDIAHKKNIGPGKYPIKTIIAILKLLELAEANAQHKGLSLENLHIKAFITNKGSTQWRYGRKRRRQTKRTNVEIIVEEKEEKKPTEEKKEEKGGEKKAEPVKEKVKEEAVEKTEKKKEEPTKKTEK